MSFACLVLGVLAATLSSRTKGQIPMLGIALSSLAMIYFLFYGAGQLLWAKFVPHSAAIIYTNVACLFAAVAAGCAWQLPDTPRWRRVLFASLLAASSFAIILWPMLSIAIRPPEPGHNYWKDGVAMQTSWANCSPAAAATLLNAEGIAVSEADMVPLCLTDSDGTPTLGLYRGIKLVAEANGRRAEVIDATLQQLLDENAWPALLAVELPYGTEDRRYADQWGWIPGMGHSVVVLGRAPGGGSSLVIGDPSRGIELWGEDDLRVLWHGNGIRLSHSNE
ncbi:peptidase C39 [Rhodopirellula sp. MGV]|uniref:peptidase C39 n=1 Tax=Rhodopirellula sp. MGV TaxID=2023130 RepID=UPI001E3E0E0F|nr:peptidase C39 [Rhodopirellula sp. MGV]